MREHVPPTATTQRSPQPPSSSPITLPPPSRVPASARPPPLLLPKSKLEQCSIFMCVHISNTVSLPLGLLRCVLTDHTFEQHNIQTSLTSMHGTAHFLTHDPTSCAFAYPPPLSHAHAHTHTHTHHSSPPHTYRSSPPPHIPLITTITTRSSSKDFVSCRSCSRWANPRQTRTGTFKAFYSSFFQIFFSLFLYNKHTLRKVLFFFLLVASTTITARAVRCPESL
jgi:hypothetical protein